jgi:hypothetical protein
MAWQELRLNPTSKLRPLYDKEDKKQSSFSLLFSLLLSLFTHNNNNNK